jgi:uncharacterized glyoxalase superfamily protein PhnB
MDAAARVRLLRSAPYLPTADVDAAVRYYEETLGFGREYVAGSPAEFAIVSRDGHPVMLRRVADPGLIRANPAQGGTWDVFFWVSDADGLYEELVGRGAEAVYGPIVQEAYGMKEFAVRALDGHVLGFGQSL